VAASGQPTAQLTDFISATSWGALPDEVRTVVRTCLLDWLAVVIAGSQEPILDPLRQVLSSEGGSASAQVLARDMRLPAHQAAMLNSAAAPVHDYDDTYYPMYGHPTAPVAGALLAVAERDGATGRRLLEALAVGVETTCRIGRALGYGPYLRGFVPSGNTGAVGASAGLARLHVLDPAQTASVLAYGAGQAAGLHGIGGLAALFQTGRAAASAVSALDVVRAGAVAAHDVLERPKGYFALRTDTPDYATLTDGLGDTYDLLDMLFKFAAACGGALPSIAAAREVSRRLGHRVEESSFDVGVSATVKRLCSIGIPRTGDEAKLSIPFCVAATVRGFDMADPATYSSGVIEDAAVQAIMSRVRVRHDDTVSEWTAEIRTSTDDRVVDITAHRTDERAGDLREQYVAVERKFRLLVEPVLGGDRVDEILPLVRDLEHFDDLGGFFALLRP